MRLGIAAAVVVAAAAGLFAVGPVVVPAAFAGRMVAAAVVELADSGWCSDEIGRFVADWFGIAALAVAAVAAAVVGPGFGSGRICFVAVAAAVVSVLRAFSSRIRN